MDSWASIVAAEKAGTLPDTFDASTWERVAFLNDLHIPFHAADVVDQVLRLLVDFDPDRIVLNGDIADFYNASRYTKDPLRRHNLHTEVLEVKAFLRRLRDMFPGVVIDFVPGNHEDRLKRYLGSQAPELASLPSLRLEELLDFAPLRIRGHPLAGFLLRPGFRVTHGTVVRKYAGWSAKAELEKWGTSGTSGHTHRAGDFTRTTDGGSLRWNENGCLCLLAPEYIHGTADWQHAFSIGWFEHGSSRFELEQIRISGGELVYHGNSYA